MSATDMGPAATGSTSTLLSGRPAHVAHPRGRTRARGRAHLHHPAIKKGAVREAASDRGWLRKVRPMFGHNYHFHIRWPACGRGGCSDQDPPPAATAAGGARPLVQTEMLHPKPGKPRPPMTMAQLPADAAVSSRGVTAALGDWVEAYVRYGRDAAPDRAGDAGAASPQ
jgi:hypothetical protein